MPSLIVSSSYTTDSQLLRQTARTLGWETLRLDGCRIADWFDPPDDQIALFCTAPDAFNIADQLSRRLHEPRSVVNVPAQNPPYHAAQKAAIATSMTSESEV